MARDRVVSHEMVPNSDLVGRHFLHGMMSGRNVIRHLDYGIPVIYASSRPTKLTTYGHHLECFGACVENS